MGLLWRIDLLGPLRLRRGEQRVTRFPQRCGHLLAYLAYFPHRPHTREQLADILWPESGADVARSNLRVALHTLRELLAPLDDPLRPLLIADRKSVRLDPEAFTTDLGEWQRALAAARASAGAARAERLAAAADLYRGELLTGFSEEWLLMERSRLLEEQIELLADAAAALEETGELHRALECARRAVSLDPLREEAHYTVMRLYAAIGQPSAVLKQYQELERCLREELGDTPSAETRALAEELSRNARTLVVARRPAPPPPPAGPESRPRRPPPAGDPPGGRPSLSPPPLPAQMTCFFGREDEITRLVELLVSPVTRLVTLTGPGGSGKTRLAIAVAGRLQELFGEAVAFVPLADLTEARLIPDAVAAALGLPRAPDGEPLEQVVAHLSGQPWLLVLDNFEHLVAEGALRVRTLLERLPLLRIVATSRQSLGLSGEQEFALLPLPTPRRSDGWEQLREYAAVQLFVDRARAARADFQLSEANAAVVGELCDRLEGLPLALELAAARMAVLTPRQLLAQLEKRFELLVGRQRDVPRRHQSLRAAIESSYQLLDPERQRFFARLSVFRGGWTLEAAQTVCEAPGALEDLEHLRDCSLLTPVEERGGEARYGLLETLREFAGEQLAASAELAAVRSRHLHWYLGLAEQAEAAGHKAGGKAAGGGEGKEWPARLEVERENLRAALAWARESDAAAEDGTELRLATALWWFWIARGPTGEGAQWLEGALARSSQLPVSLRARAFYRLTMLAFNQGDLDRMRSAFLAARQAYDEALEHARKAPDHREVAESLLALTWVCCGLSDLEAGWSYGLEARQPLEAMEHWEGVVDLLNAMANISMYRRDLPRTRALLEELLALWRQRNLSLHRIHTIHLIHTFGGMAHRLREEGDHAGARAHYQESLRIRWELGLLFPVAQALEDLAVLEGAEGEAERAARLLGAGEALCRTLGTRPPAALALEYERTLAESRAALGAAAFARAWAAGQLLPLEEVIREALEAHAEPGLSAARAGPEGDAVPTIGWAPGTGSAG